MSNSHRQPFEEYYRYRHSHQDDAEQATGGTAMIRPSLRMSESWFPSWVSSDEDSSSLDTGSSGLITPQMIYEQRRILLDIEERQQSEKQDESDLKLQYAHQPSAFGGTAHDRSLLSRSGSSSGSITSMEDKSILNQSVHMFLDIEESEAPAANMPSSSSSSSSCEDSFEQELTNAHAHHNMDPFRDEEEESYPHHRIHFHPGRRRQHLVEDPTNEITRSTHTAHPIPIPSELPSRYQPRRPPQPLQISEPLEATLVDEEHHHPDVEALRSQMEQDLEQSKVFRKSLQEEAERLRNRILEMEEQEPKGSCTTRRWKNCGWIWGLVILVGGVLVANLMLYGGKWIPFLAKERNTVSSDASLENNVTMAPTLAPPQPSASSLDPSSLAPTCQRPEMSAFFGNGSYRAKFGKLDGRYDVDCKREMSTRMLIVLQVSAASSCQVQCVGSLLPSEYTRQCPDNNRGPLTNSTANAAVKPMGGGSGGGGSPPPDVDFVVSGDYRNEILYLGYASSDSDLDCSQKLILV